jgi:Lon protease-like protein
MATKVPPMPDRALHLAAEALPLFPLSGVVLLPSAVLPLHVFEPRYRSLVADVIAADGLFAIPQIRPDDLGLADGTPRLLSTAGMGRIVRHQILPDGRSNILVMGLARVKILDEHPADRAYRVARAVVRPDLCPPEATLRRLVEQVRFAVHRVLLRRLPIGPELVEAAALDQEPVALLHTVANRALGEADSRQAWIEEDDVLTRGELLLGVLTALGTETTEAEA